MPEESGIIDACFHPRTAAKARLKGFVGYDNPNWVKFEDPIVSSKIRIT